MTIKERIKDVKDLEIFNKKEIEEHKDVNSIYTILKSWEYYLIFHFTNEELYYIDVELNDLNSADLIKNTKKGKIYGFK